MSYDGGPEIELLKIDAAFWANTRDALNESLELDLKNPAGAKTPYCRHRRRPRHPSPHSDWSRGVAKGFPTADGD